MAIRSSVPVIHIRNNPSSLLQIIPICLLLPDWYFKIFFLVLYQTLALTHCPKRNKVLPCIKNPTSVTELQTFQPLNTLFISITHSKTPLRVPSAGNLMAKVLCLQQDLWYGDCDSHCTLEIQPSSFLMKMQQFKSLSDDDASSNMFPGKF
jgi:hypothetical protein